MGAANTPVSGRATQAARVSKGPAQALDRQGPPALAHLKRNCPRSRFQSRSKSRLCYEFSSLSKWRERGRTLPHGTKHTPSPGGVRPVVDSQLWLHIRITQGAFKYCHPSPTPDQLSQNLGWLGWGRWKRYFNVRVGECLSLSPMISPPVTWATEPAAPGKLSSCLRRGRGKALV